jgi:DASS family divalent anion:Na+ symporter
MIPVPSTNIDPKGWSLFAIFVSTIVGVVLKPMPMGPVALLGLLVATLTGTLDLAKEGLTGYSSPIVWLIIFVFFIARGFIKTQLGTRMAYLFVNRIGYHTLGIAYGLAATELIIAPVIPSNSARAGGIMYPITKSIAESLGSYPGDASKHKVGSFLIQVSYHCNLIVSAMFLTAMAANPMAQAFAAKQGITITWGNWFMAASVPGIISMIIIPLLLYWVYPPETKSIPHVVELTQEKLQSMGPMSKKEWIMAITFLSMLVLWIFGDFLAINSTTTALIGVSVLLLTKVLTLDDILAEREAWHTLIWFAILLTMANYLEKFGFVGWFSDVMGSLVLGSGWVTTYIVLILVYFYSHYFFASNTAHISAMYAAFLSVALAAGSPPLVTALTLGFCGSLFSSITHYGSGSSVVLYGAGYVPVTTWWRLGFMVSVVNLIIWLGIGGMWWKVLGLW